MQQSICIVLRSLHRCKFRNLYTRPAKSRVPDIIPDALIPDVLRVDHEVGPDRNKSSISEAYNTVINSDYVTTPWRLTNDPSRLGKCLVWREKHWLKAREIILLLSERGWLDTDRIACLADDQIDGNMTEQAWRFFYAACPETGRIHRWAYPDYDALGFYHYAPLIRICNILRDNEHARNPSERDLGGYGGRDHRSGEVT